MKIRAMNPAKFLQTATSLLNLPTQFFLTRFARFALASLGAGWHMVCVVLLLEGCAWWGFCRTQLGSFRSNYGVRRKLYLEANATEADFWSAANLYLVNTAHTILGR